MDQDGFYPPHPCERCGQLLQGFNGNNPAELYAGTYTGLCNKCMREPVYVVGESDLDGVKLLSYPPACPSWSRERFLCWAYEDCPNCNGNGRHIVWSGSGGQFSSHCKVCFDRYWGHPVRKIELE